METIDLEIKFVTSLFCINIVFGLLRKQKQFWPDKINMEFTLLTIMLFLCTWLLLPLILISWYMSRRYMNRGTSYNIKNRTISVLSVSTSIHINVPSVIQPETPPSTLLIPEGLPQQGSWVPGCCTGRRPGPAPSPGGAKTPEEWETSSTG